MEDIKKNYKKHITIYFLVYFLINIIIVFGVKIDSLNIKSLFENEVLIKILASLVMLPILSITSLVVLNILPTKFKNVLIFWKIKDILPSYRWKIIIAKDDRINSKSLKKIYGRSLTPQKQHDIWYEKYKLNRNDVRILNSQKDYLFSRDLCISTVILTIIISILYIVGWVLLKITPILFFLNFLTLSILYIIFVIVARNNANRFVADVLAIDIIE